MIHQLYFEETQKARLFQSPLYRGFGLYTAVNPEIARNCPELRETRNQPLLSEYGAMLHIWRNPEVDPDSWVGFTSYRQLDKFPAILHERADLETWLQSVDIVGWGFYEFRDAQTHQNLSLAEFSEIAHPGIMSCLWQLLLLRQERMPSEFLNDNVGLFANYWAMSKANFQEYMEWSYPMVQHCLTHPDAFVKSHPRSVAYLVERLFICWYLLRRKSLFRHGPLKRMFCRFPVSSSMPAPDHEGLTFQATAWNATLAELCRRHQVRPRGIIHVGAHYAEERHVYEQAGVTSCLWIEADPLHLPQLQANLAGFPESRAIQACLSNRDGERVAFHRTNNRGESSSLLEMGSHTHHFQDIQVTEQITLETVTFQALVERENIDVDVYDFLVVDVQGAELQALQGFGQLLSGFRGIYLEVNLEHLYQKCALLSEVDAYLYSFGFTRREALITTKKYGDALYLKSDLGSGPAPAHAERAEHLRAQLVLQRTHMLHMIGQGQRVIELMEGGRLGIGATALEQSWRARSAGSEIVLELFGPQGRTCCLTNLNDFVWRGFSLIPPNRDAELIPAGLATRHLPPNAYPEGTNLPLPLAKRLRDRLRIDTFVETGTHLGVTAGTVAPLFKRVVTIELSPAAQARAAEALARFPHVECIQGDSCAELPKVLKPLDRPALIWLDAHWSGRDTAQADTECPLMKELTIIYAHRKDHVVLIDDARMFLTPPPPPHNASHWPTIGVLCSFLACQEPPPYVRLVGDVLVAGPPSIADLIESYGNQRGL